MLHIPPVRAALSVLRLVLSDSRDRIHSGRDVLEDVLPEFTRGSMHRPRKMMIVGCAIVVAAGLYVSSSAAPPPTSSPDSEVAATVEGEALLLSELLRDRGISADSESASTAVVIRTKGGRILPLIRDEASRALFLDERLRHRPLVLKVREYPNLPFAQVMTIQVFEEGRPGVPEYYCEVCTISVRSPQICPCCQGPMELRMRPQRRD